jgi:hypothetical protein
MLMMAILPGGLAIGFLNHVLVLVSLNESINGLYAVVPSRHQMFCVLFSDAGRSPGNYLREGYYLQPYLH